MTTGMHPEGHGHITRQSYVTRGYFLPRVAPRVGAQLVAVDDRVHHAQTASGAMAV